MGFYWREFFSIQHVKNIVLQATVYFRENLQYDLTDFSQEIYTISKFLVANYSAMLWTIWLN